MKKILFLTSSIILFFSCSGIKMNPSKATKSLLNSHSHKNQFTGILVIDASTKDTLYNYNSSRYFTPASNTKIFTLYSALKVLPKKIPTLQYILQKDTLYAQGTGNPTLLHPYFKDSTAILFLKKHKNIAFDFSNYKDAKYGPGWAWEDYDTYFSPERSALPIHGNVLTVHHKDSLVTNPEYFKDSISLANVSKHRALNKNIFYYKAEQKDTLEIPFITNTNISRELLESALNRKVTVVSKLPDGPKNTLYSIATDSVYKRMMHESDNFLAEQLLVLCSGVLKDTLNFKITRDYVLNTHLRNLRQPPRWVDASGLSRYNLFTPESMVHILYKLYEEVPLERLYTLFPVETNSNSDKNKVVEQPYIHAKSGSLGNNYCLSGYLQTRTGKTLIFSFMNNHYTISTKEVKNQMHKIFEEIRDTY